MCVQVEGVAEQELQSLHDTVYDQALVWVNSLKREQKERIEGHFGPMPGKDSVLQVQTQIITLHHTHRIQCMVLSKSFFSYGGNMGSFMYLSGFLYYIFKSIYMFKKKFVY